MPDYKIATVGEVEPGQGRTVKVADKQIALFNVDGEYFAVDDRCPHMGAELSGGVVRERTVLCTWHGWQFDLETGSCMNIEWAKLQRYPLSVRGDEIVLTLEPEPDPAEEPQEKIPEIVWREPQGG